MSVGQVTSLASVVILRPLSLYLDLHVPHVPYIRFGSSKKNTATNLKAATSLVWSCCYDLGCIRAYCSDNIWDDVCKSIRKVIKSAGLDHMTSTEIVYRVSTGYSPDLMALKQIVQMGLKFIDKDMISESYKVTTNDSDKTRPFWHRFVTEFNAMPYDLRSFIATTLEPGNKSALEKIKRRLKTHYINLYNPNGKLSKEKIKNLVNENSYSKEKIEKRKRDYEVIRQTRIEASKLRAIREEEKLYTTPCKRRKKFSTTFVTPVPLRNVAKCHGPERLTKAQNLRSECSLAQSTPIKRKRESSTEDETGTVSKRANIADSVVSPSRLIENPRRAIPETVDLSFFELPHEKSTLRWIEVEPKSSPSKSIKSGQLVVPNSEGTEFGFTESLDM